MNQNDLLFIFTIIILLINLNIIDGEEQKYIEQKITLEKDNAYITVSIGGQENKNFYISLFSPIILTFPELKDNNNRYNKTEGNFTSKNISSQIIGQTTNTSFFDFVIGEEIFNLSENIKDVYLDVGVIHKTNFTPNNNISGVFGLIRDSDGIENLTNEYVFMNQLLKKNIISKKIFYISNYYNKSGLMNEAKLIIGKFPENFNEENKEALPSCEFDETYSKNYYDCKISGISIKKNDLNIMIYEENTKTILIGRFEEFSLQHSSLPKQLFDGFYSYFCDLEKCLNESYTINCANNLELINRINITIVINDYEFILNPKNLWENGKLNLIFDRDGNLTIFASELIGNYHRIYDIEEKKIYFSAVDDNIINKNDNNDYHPEENKKKDDDKTSIWLIIICVGFGVLILFIIILIIIICILKKKDNELNKKIKSISFVDGSSKDYSDENFLCNDNI